VGSGQASVVSVGSQRQKRAREELRWLLPKLGWQLANLKLPSTQLHVWNYI
jgi:hypothetical protein